MGTGVEVSVADFFTAYKEAYERTQPAQMTLEDYLRACKKDPAIYANAHARLLDSLGTPEKLDIASDKKLSRIFDSRIINKYPALDDFFGMEDVIQEIEDYLRAGAPGQEAKHKILYLYGPPGTAKSSLATRLAELMQARAIYVLQYKKDESATPEKAPHNESPLSLFKASDLVTGKESTVKFSKKLEADFGIPEHALPSAMSPWVREKLQEAQGDLSKFSVIQLYPSILNSEAIAKIAAGDEEENGTEVLNKALGKANQGLLEYEEMLKVDRKNLLPFLQVGAKGVYGQEPFDGIVIGHSNAGEAESFFKASDNEGMRDRTVVIPVPYVTRISAEEQVYEKLLGGSALADIKPAPMTLRMAATFAVMTRLTGNSDEVLKKARVLDGEDQQDVSAPKDYKGYKAEAKANGDGMKGVSARYMDKILADTFNANARSRRAPDQKPLEVEANPVNLFRVIKETAAKSKHDTHATIVDALEKWYKELLRKEIESCSVEEQSAPKDVFKRYYTFADYWVQNAEYRDPDTGENYDRPAIIAELKKMEVRAGLDRESDAIDFRRKITNAVLRAPGGIDAFNWESDPKLKAIVKQQTEKTFEELRPVIEFKPKETAKEKQKHDEFVDRMVHRGYSQGQVRLLVDYALK